MRASRLVICSLVALTFAACTNGNPAGPSDMSGSLAFPLMGMGCGAELDGYQCHAAIEYANGTRKEVTGLATWSTSDPSIATVNSVGFVTVYKSEEVAIRAEYQNVSGFLIMKMEAGGQRKYFRALSGFVTDAQTSAKLPGVRVEILDGANAGRTAVTGPDGAYQMYDLELGTFTVRFSKDGYRPAEHIYVLTGDKFNGLPTQLTR